MDRRLSRRNARSLVRSGRSCSPSPALRVWLQLRHRPEYTPANGVNNQHGDVDVLNAVIVSSEDGSGTFVATLSTTPPTRRSRSTSLSFGSNSTVEVAPFDPIEVPAARPRQPRRRPGHQGRPGDFAAGDFVELSLAFGNGETADMDVPVVAAD